MRTATRDPGSAGDACAPDPSRDRARQAVRALLCILVMVFAGSIAAGGVGAPPTAPTLVVDNSFALDTIDPQHEYDPTPTIVDRAIYDTLFTYRGSNLTEPVPLLVKSWTTAGAKRFVFRLRSDVHFADGTPLTSADVVFSFRRLVNLQGNPSYLLAGFTVSATGKHTVVITSKTPAPQLPAILTFPATGIVNSKLVEEHGGSDAADASTADTAETWLDSPASAGAGSGPYELQSYNPTSQIVLRANPNYWGAKKPAFGEIVLRNMLASTQLINIQRGADQIALDLSSDQADTLKGKTSVHVTLQPSVYTFYAFTNDDPHVSPVTSNEGFQKALRYALDYRRLVSVAGPGAIEAPGIIPTMILGSLPSKAAAGPDLVKAKQALMASGVGAERVTLDYPSDLTINGLPFSTVAQKVQAELQAAGFNVGLAGFPTAVYQSMFRAGKVAFGIWWYSFAYPDPSNYVVFEPGNLVALHAGWAAGSDPAVEKLFESALAATAPSARRALYQRIQLGMNASSPFVPLLQPAQAFVATRDLAGAVFNGAYLVDLTQVSPS